MIEILRRPGILISAAVRECQLRALIQRMAVANPYWGAPRIHGELLKLGIAISERTVSPLMPKKRKPPFPDLEGLSEQPCPAVDFFTVPRVSFRVLFVFVVLAMVEAFPEDQAPRYRLRDRDKIWV